MQILKPKFNRPAKLRITLSHLEDRIQKHKAIMHLASQCKNYIDEDYGPPKRDEQLLDRIRHLRSTMLFKGSLTRRAIRKDCSVLLAELQEFKSVTALHDGSNLTTEKELVALSEEQRKAVLSMSDEERGVIWQKCGEETDAKIRYVEKIQDEFSDIFTSHSSY